MISRPTTVLHKKYPSTLPRACLLAPSRCTHDTHHTSHSLGPVSSHDKHAPSQWLPPIAPTRLCPSAVRIHPHTHAFAIPTLTFTDNILPPDAESNAKTQGPPLLDEGETSVLGNFFDDPDRFKPSDDAFSDPFMTHMMSSFDKTQFDPSWPYQTYPQDTNNLEVQPTYTSGIQSSSTRVNNHMPLPPTPVSAAGPLLSHMSATAPEDPYNLPAHAPPEVLNAIVTLRAWQAQAREVEQTPYHMQSHFETATPAITRHHSMPHHSPTTAVSTAYNSAYYPSTDHHYRTSLDTSSALHHPSSTLHDPSPTLHDPSPTFNMPARHSIHGTVPPFHFGSDNNFGRNGFTTALTGMENVAGHMKFARVFAGTNGGGVASAESSLPHSPVMNRNDREQPDTTFRGYVEEADEYEDHVYEQPKPKRRRKTKTMATEEPDVQLFHTQPTTFNDQSSPDTNNVFDAMSPQDSDGMPTGSDRKRRKSSSAAQARASALARKNLTEEQKRENHIKSEQKRRNIIKEGYRELNQLVPNLKQGGFSKSNVLTETVRELEGLQAGNARMEEYLNSLKMKGTAAKVAG